MTPCVKHISMWRVQAGIGQTKAQTMQVLEQAVARLRGRVTGLRKIELGIDLGGPSERADVVLYSEFDTAEDLLAYQHHQDHLTLVELLKVCRTESRVVDYVSASEPPH